MIGQFLLSNLTIWSFKGAFFSPSIFSADLLHAATTEEQLEHFLSTILPGETTTDLVLPLPFHKFL